MSTSFEIALPSECETDRLGKILAKWIYPGLALLLFGDLGAGKTHLCKGIGKTLGFTAVRSPSFAIINRYEGEVPFIHCDLYRLSAAAVPVFELDEAIMEGAFLVVEWADRWMSPPDEDVWRVAIEYDLDDESEERIARLSALGDRAQTLLASAVEEFLSSGGA